MSSYQLWFHVEAWDEINNEDLTVTMVPKAVTFALYEYNGPKVSGPETFYSDRPLAWSPFAMPRLEDALKWILGPAQEGDLVRLAGIEARLVRRWIGENVPRALFDRLDTEWIDPMRTTKQADLLTGQTFEPVKPSGGGISGIEAAREQLHWAAQRIRLYTYKGASNGS